MLESLLSIFWLNWVIAITIYFSPVMIFSPIKDYQTLVYPSRLSPPPLFGKCLKFCCLFFLWRPSIFIIFQMFILIIPATVNRPKAIKLHGLIFFRFISFVRVNMIGYFVLLYRSSCEFVCLPFLKNHIFRSCVFYKYHAYPFFYPSIHFFFCRPGYNDFFL